MNTAKGLLLSGVGAFAGEAVYTATGAYNFVVPEGVFSLCVVAVGPSIGSAPFPTSGGGLCWANDIAVQPGEVIALAVNAAAGSWFKSTGHLLAGFGATSGGVSTGSLRGGGGVGGRAYAIDTGGGGGAGGYTGNGGEGGRLDTNDYGMAGAAGLGGGAGGGGAGRKIIAQGGSGGGVGLYGLGANGAGGSGGGSSFNNGGHGVGGSGGASGDTASGGLYGGGRGTSAAAVGGRGAIRILWGDGRAFPSTKVDAASSYTITNY